MNFKYEALTESGRAMAGTLEASDFEQARTALEAMKLTVSVLETAKPPARPTAIGRDDFILFNQQLAAITQSGIPLEKALRAVAAEAATGRVRHLTLEIADELEKGMPLDQVFERHEKEFPAFYGRILKAGLQSGRLGEMLVSLNRHLTLAGRTRAILLDTLTYPAIVLAVIMAVSIMVSRLIVSTATTVFSEFGTGFPSLMHGSIYLAEHVWHFWGACAGLLVVVFVMMALMKRSAQGRLFLERVLLGLPLLGPIFRYGKLSHFSDCMALLIRGGSDGPEALIAAAGVVNSESIVQESALVAGQLHRGAGYLEAGQVCSFIPRLFFYSMQIGARRQEVEENLTHLSVMYQDRLLALQKQLSAFMIPALLLVLGVMVGGAVVMLVLPIASMIESLS